MRALSNKINFFSFDKVAIMQFEMYLPSIPIHANNFCDSGLRYQRNKFDRTDSWLSKTNLKENFYDVLIFNNDCMNVDDPEDPYLGVIAFRLNN